MTQLTYNRSPYSTSYITVQTVQHTAIPESEQYIQTGTAHCNTTKQYTYTDTHNYTRQLNTCNAHLVGISPYPICLVVKNIIAIQVIQI